jgi:aconitase B
LAAVVAKLGKIPSPEDYFAAYRERLSGRDRLYEALQFDRI